MKNLTKRNTKLIYILVLAMMLFITFGNIASKFAYVYADGPAESILTPGPTDNKNPGGSVDASLSTLEEKADNTIQSVQKTVVAFATAFGVLAEIVCIALILFTHDDRKISGYIKIAITIPIVLVVIYLINGGVFLDLIKDFAASLGGKE